MSKHIVLTSQRMTLLRCAPDFSENSLSKLKKIRFFFDGFSLWLPFQVGSPNIFEQCSHFSHVKPPCFREPPAFL
ncbi:hypothetical protein Y032_0526g2954 [Ancylostoma ceylanicum]|uniref:Uncharacterized protein n=1 Tax=Ancylostoma ceylanicum TaxID=53326 RepID=A0A016WS17_9BILA|nr:hypothetical protein Y032_0526g2954 [Ancylostoma ceylanicum]